MAIYTVLLAQNDMNVETERLPRVTIGMPVYNAADTISAALDSILSQTYEDFEVVISDNASTDGTSEICRRYAARDARIKYILQPSNIGATNNFAFVFTQARAPYFAWAASDDIRNTEYLAANVSFLETHPDYVLSTSPNTFDVWPEAERVTFEIKGSIYQCFLAFFRNCFKSHAFFYSVMRTEVLRKCAAIQVGLLSTMARHRTGITFYSVYTGMINRADRGLIIFGTKGNSAGPEIYYKMSEHPVEFVFPFFYFSKYVLVLSAPFSWWERLRIAWILLALNVHAKMAPLVDGFHKWAAKAYREVVPRR